MSDLTEIITFVLNNIWSVLPYFLLSMALAVLINKLEFDGYIRHAFNKSLGLSIILATLVGAFSPFCSCTVIPIVSGLLLSGVPLAPVMAFWIASPTMDPEIFALTVGVLGWPMATARLLATLALSLGAGYLTLMLTRTGLLSTVVVQAKEKVTAAVEAAACCAPAAESTPQPHPQLAFTGEGTIPLTTLTLAQPIAVATPTESDCCGSEKAIPLTMVQPTAAPAAVESSCCSSEAAIPLTMLQPVAAPVESSCGCSSEPTATNQVTITSESTTIMGKLRTIDWADAGREMGTESWRIGRWLVVAFLLEALILLYVPQEAIAGILGDNPFSTILAALVGIPLYLSNYSALPIVDGLLTQGMQPGAAIAFLIAGPVTTMPAMTAVWGIVHRRVFVLYLSLALLGAILLGVITNLVL